MNVRKLAALLAAVTIIVALAVGVTTPANAQGRHHGRYYHHVPPPSEAVPVSIKGGPGSIMDRRTAHPYHGSPTLGVWIHL